MASVEVPTMSILLCLFLSYLALAGASNYASESVVVVGKVFCDPCLEHRLSENGYVISGAWIAVECGLNRKTMTLSVMGETDENGEFKIEIPSYIVQSADQLKTCRVRPPNSPLDSCKIPMTFAPSKLTLQLDSNGVITYSAGSFSYRHETVPSSCYRKHFITTMKGRAMAQNVDQSSRAGQSMPTVIPQAIVPNVSPLPSFGIPPLPTVPPLPNIGFPPLPTVPPLPTIPPLPLPTIPPLPLPCFPLPQIPPLPPLPTIPPLPKIPPLPPCFPLPTIPPVPKIPPLPPGFPPLPTIPPLPKIPPLPPGFPPLPTIPPLPKIPPLPLPSFPPLPTIPPLPEIPSLPPSP